MATQENVEGKERRGRFSTDIREIMDEITKREEKGLESHRKPLCGLITPKREKELNENKRRK